MAGAFLLTRLAKRQNAVLPAVRLNCWQIKEVVGFFPEGAQPMVQVQSGQPAQPISSLRFAPSGLRAPVRILAIPAGFAIVSTEEERHNLAPLKLFSCFDPTEPLFNCGDWHSAIVIAAFSFSLFYPVGFQ